jgi:hypothetical protein
VLKYSLPFIVTQFCLFYIHEFLCLLCYYNWLLLVAHDVGSELTVDVLSNCFNYQNVWNIWYEGRFEISLCHVLGGLRDLQNRFWIWWSNLLGLYAAGYKESTNHYLTDTLSSCYGWTLHWSCSGFQLNGSVWASHYIITASCRMTAQKRNLLPSNGYMHTHIENLSHKHWFCCCVHVLWALPRNGSTLLLVAYLLRVCLPSHSLAMGRLHVTLYIVISG